MKKLLLTALGAVFLCPAAVADSAMPADLDEHIMDGVQGIHSLAFDKADENFNWILTNYPGQPYGYFGLAVCSWARLEYQEEQSSPELEKEFIKRTETAVEQGKKWIAKYPDDAYAHVCLGGIYGLQARLELMQHKWVSAFLKGKSGLKAMRRALKLDPELYDAKIGPGMYEYYAGTLGGFLKVLNYLFIRGNADDGIKLLNEVEQKGHFNKMVAKLLLIEIYTQTGSKYSRPDLALKMAKEVRAVYPDHPLVQFIEIVCQYEDRHYGQVRELALDFLKKIEEGKPDYLPRYYSRAYTALATSYLAEKEYDSALQHFAKAASYTSKEKPNRWAVWAEVRAGEIYDWKGDRASALTQYKRANEYEDLWGFKDYISAHIKRPVTMKDFPGQLPPP
ncbi:MAG: hypothetical protein PHW69_06920 [Elusimicrobiaceae bacterium]|nr:hypothetical protein [Elusimicrobiaceae bacterium]